MTGQEVYDKVRKLELELNELYENIGVSDYYSPHWDRMHYRMASAIDKLIEIEDCLTNLNNERLMENV